MNRLKELEKLTKKLGVKVNCIGCNKKIYYKNAIILTNKERVTYLCEECYNKLENGKLNKQIIDKDIILEKLRKLSEQNNSFKIKPAGDTKFIPNVRSEPMVWKEESTFKKGNISYTISSLNNQNLFKIKQKILKNKLS
jgi:transposase